MYESRSERIHGTIGKSQKPSSQTSPRSSRRSENDQSGRARSNARMLLNVAIEIAKSVVTSERLTAHQSSGLPIELMVRTTFPYCSKRIVIGFSGKSHVYQCDKYGCFHSFAAAWCAIMSRVAQITARTSWAWCVIDKPYAQIAP